MYKTMGAASLGALIGYILNVPMGSLFGAVIGVLILGRVMSVPLSLPKQTIVFIQTTLGLSVGSVVSFGSISSLFSPVLFIALICCLAIQTMSAYLWLNRREGWSGVDSFLGAIPGALAAILSMGDNYVSASPKVIFAHSVRLIILVTMAAFVSYLMPTDMTVQAIDASWGTKTVLSLSIVALSSLLLGYFASKLGVPAPYMVMALICSVIAQEILPTGVFVVPSMLVALSTVALGAFLGLRLSEVETGNVLSYVRAGVFVTAISMSVTALFSYVMSLVTGVEWLVLLLSWVPGNVEAMTAVALMFGLEPAFVMINHVVRLGVLHALPLVFRQFLLQQKQ
ncbi:AbrB family transcriptional regulator [uncultured Vibrio sp.]|uniref:AbrB family transcriptional regulator n=1 Tax=uncultured Vibrio sp. TaxID=114054 RepID=UPI0009235CD5|nr:AbrB family transcriptional regulator [uncultured Vibrio sp.]OIQ26420.1 MAG: hypothetical protein BM561_01275 [Vibrio sp. MedPE-SWchi]